VSSSAIGSVLESVLGSVLESHSEVYFGAYSEVFLGVSEELTWERTVKQAGRVPSSAIGSVVRAYL